MAGEREAKRILKDEGRQKGAEDADAFSLVAVFFPRSNWASIICGSASGSVRNDKGAENQCVRERERGEKALLQREICRGIEKFTRFDGDVWRLCVRDSLSSELCHSAHLPRDR